MNSKEFKDSSQAPSKSLHHRNFSTQSVVILEFTTFSNGIYVWIWRWQQLTKGLFISYVNRTKWNLCFNIYEHLGGFYKTQAVVFYVLGFKEKKTSKWVKLVPFHWNIVSQRLSRLVLLVLVSKVKWYRQLGFKQTY